MTNNLSNKSTIKAGTWFTISNFLIKAIGFITTPIFTRLMTKAEFGNFSNFITWLGIIYIVTSLNLEASLIRSKFDFKEKFNDYLISMVALSEISTLVWFFVFQVFDDQFAHIFSIDKIYLNCLFVYLFFNPIIDIFVNAQRLNFHYKSVAVTSLILSGSTSLLSVLFVLIFDDRLNGRILGYLIPYAIIGTVVLLFLLSKSKKVTILHWKYSLPIVLPYIPHLLSLFLLGSMDKVMIKKICGAEELALYSLAYTVGSMITILANSVNSAFSPWLAERLNSKEYDRISEISIYYSSVAAVLAICAVLVTPEVLLILGGNSYIEATNVLPPVAGSCLVQFIYCMYVNVEQYEKKTVGMAIASVIAAVINFVTNVLFIPKYGYIAAAYTTLFSYLCLMFMHIFLVKKIGRKYVYKTKLIVPITLLATTVIVLMGLIMNNIVIRYACLSIIAITIIAILVQNKEFIKNTYKNRYM